MILEHLAKADICSLFLLGIALNVAGSAVSTRQPDARQWGLKAGVGTFLLSLGYWIVLFGVGDVEFFAGRLIQATVFGIVICGTLTAAIPVITWCYRYLIDEPRSRLSRWSSSRKYRDQEEEFRRQQDHRQQEERRRRQQDEERKAKSQAEQQHEQSIRQDARFEVRAYYDAHSEIAGKLPPERFERYLAEDLADAHPAEKVRERAEKLIEMMREMGGSRSMQRWNSEEEIVAHFTAAMQRYGEAGCYSQAEVETLQSEVRMQMHRALEEFRRGGT